jgi:hypothetical protein
MKVYHRSPSEARVTHLIENAGVKQIDQAWQTDHVSKFAKPTFAQHRAYVCNAAKV